jgi:hypothetical protein
MGHLTSSILGLPSGKAGDLVFRRRHGKSVFYVCPDNSTKIRSEKVKENNFKLSYCASFSAALASVRALNTAWLTYPVKASTVYTKIMKLNMKQIKPEACISDMLLIPGDDKFDTSITDCRLNEKELLIEFAPCSKYYSMEKLISAQGILQLRSPENDKLRQVQFLPVFSKDLDYVSGTQLLFSIKFDAQTEELVSKYSEKNLLINLAIKDIQSFPERFSREVYIEML